VAGILERTVLLPDDVRRDFLEEVESELSGRSRGKWALLVVAFVTGAVCATFVLARVVRDRAEPVEPAEPASGAIAT
jgi:hypothetical protein